MIRGTTPTHVFTLPFDASYVKSIRITYTQDDVEILRKETSACAIEGSEVRLTLTQEETLLFDCAKCVHLQIRVLTQGGEALASDPIPTSVGKCLDGEVIT